MDEDFFWGIVVGVIATVLIAIIINVTSNDTDVRNPDNELQKALCYSHSGETLFDGFIWGHVSRYEPDRHEFNDPYTGKSIYVNGDCVIVPVELESLDDEDRRKIHERHFASDGE